MSGPVNRPPKLSVEEMIAFLMPLPKDDLTDERRAEIMSQINVGQPARYMALQNALEQAGWMARLSGADDGGRKAAIYALTCIFAYFNDAPGISGHLAPIGNLLNALTELEEGRAVHRMFDAPGSATLTRDRAEAHSAIAAWSHILGLAGMNQGDADRAVAQKIGALGYRKRGVRQAPATPRTVAEWRGEALQPDARGVIPASFQRIVRAFSEAPPAARTVERVNDDFHKLLLSQWPHLFPVSTKAPSFSGN